MNAEEIASELRLMLETMSEYDVQDLREAGIEPTPIMPCAVSSFADRGLLTRDAGLVITLADGSEYQITVVQSPGAALDLDDPYLEDPSAS